MLETAKKGAQSKSLRPASAIEWGLPQTKQHTLKENKAAMKIHVQVFMWVFMALGSMLRDMAAGSQGKHIFNFLTSYPTMFQLATHFTVPSKCMKSSFPKTLPIFKSTRSYSWHFSRSVADLISVPTVTLTTYHLSSPGKHLIPLSLTGLLFITVFWDFFIFSHLL